MVSQLKISGGKGAASKVHQKEVPEVRKCQQEEK